MNRSWPLLLLLVVTRASAQSGHEPQSGNDPADAQATPSTTSASPREVIEVQIIGQRAESMQKVPGLGTSIGQEEIERSASYDAAELLARVPGFHVRQDSGAGGRLDIGVRGLDPGRSRRVLLLEDGVPMGNNPYAEPDLYWAPPVQRWAGVEVVKGSGNILFGPQTVGGVVNFITPPVPWRRSVSVEARGGQRGFAHAFARYGDRYGQVGHVSQVVFRRGDGFRQQGFRALDALSKVEFPTSPTGRATLKLSFHDAAFDADDVGLTTKMFAADPHRPTLAPENAAQLRRYHASLTHEQRFDDTFSLKTLAYAYTLSRVWTRQDYVRYPEPGVGYARIVGDPSTPGEALYFLPSQRALDRSYDVAGLEPKLRAHFDTAGVGHTLDAGVRALFEHAHYEQRNSASLQNDSGALVLDETRSSVAVAAYIQDRIAFASEFILVTPGLRLEHVRYARHIKRQPTSSGAEDVNIEGQSHLTTLIPGLGMTVGLPELHGFAGLHLGFAPPRVATSIRTDGVSTELDAEKSLSYEAGLRVRRGRVLQLQLGGFLSNYSNQVVPASVGDRTTLVNGGATQQFGLETEATARLDQHLPVGLELSVAARYTLMQAHFRGGPRDGRRLPYAPNHLGHFSIDLGHTTGIATQLSYRYVGEQFTDNTETMPVDPTGRFGLMEAYHRLDATLRYRHAPSGLTASLSVKDIPDQPFVISRRPEGIFASGFRQIMAGLRWDYEEEPTP